MTFRRLRRRSIQPPRIILTPLIDTVLVLLVVFLVTMPVVHHMITINVPESSSATGTMQEALVVGLDKQRGWYVQDSQVSEAIALALIHERASACGNRIIFDGDQQLSYKQIVAALDKIKKVAPQATIMLGTLHDQRA
jgi:biopolymer transport protein ExbD